MDVELVVVDNTHFEERIATDLNRVDRSIIPVNLVYPPNYPEEPSNDEERSIQDRYAHVLGSSVNPVLREGNSDRRAPESVKAFARKHPHPMDKWSQASSTHVAHMRHGDFYHSEKSVTLDKGGELKIELIQDDGTTTVLREGVPVEDGEVVDGMYMSVAALREFLEEEYEGALRAGLLALR